MDILTFPLTQMLLLALLIESIMELIKSVFGDKIKKELMQILSMLVGIGLALVMQISIFNLPKPQYYIGVVLAGLICSRGSNFVHDFYDKQTKILKEKK